MAGGAVFLDPNRRKIKGKRLTVLRFFTVSVAYTIGWYTICSELDYFKTLFGPQILLQLNIAYYLPSIPLLLISGHLDQALEQRFGVAAVVLARLMVGLLGCAAITSIFPLAFWLHNETHAHLYILGCSVALGLCTGIAFSASYQLVSRFANKNVIALGLGFVCSGLVTLVLQVTLELLPLSAWTRQLLMYQTVSAITLAGLTGALTILYRKRHELEEIVAEERAAADDAADHAHTHHDTIDEEPATPDAHLPLLHTMHAADGPPSPLGPSTHNHTPRSTLDGSMRRVSSLSRLPSLAAFDFIDPAQSLPLWESGDCEVAFQPGSIPEGHLLVGSREGSRRMSMASGGRGASFGGWGGGALGSPQPRSWSPQAPPSPPMMVGVPEVLFGSGVEVKEEGSPGDVEAGAGEARTPLMEILLLIWPILVAFFLSGVTILVVFPFFTYIESSGLIGERLPKVLFFVRFLGDIVGRLMPRSRVLTVTSPLAILALGSLMVGTVPLYFLYIKAPAMYRSDVGIMLYIVLMWLLCGYVNTTCNITAPKLVKPTLKAGAAGLMAIVFQVSHFTGLVLAIGVSFALFGGLIHH